MSTTIRIDGLGTLKRVTAPFNEALATLAGMGIRSIVSLRDIAVARMQAGDGHLLFKADSFTREAVVYTASGLSYFVRTSPLLDSAMADAAAVEHRRLETLAEANDPRHREGVGEIMLGQTIPATVYDDIVRLAGEDAAQPVEQRRVLVHQGCDVLAIPTNRLGGHDLTRWALGGAAEEFGRFLRARHIYTCMVWLVDWLNPDPARKPFIRQLVMNGRNGDINGGRRLGWDDGHMGGTWGIGS